MKTRRFDPSRTTFVSGAAVSDNAKTEFRLVPPGAAMNEIPPFELADESKSVGAANAGRIDKKPYIFGIETIDEMPECREDYYDLEEYAAHLTPYSR